MTDNHTSSKYNEHTGKTPHTPSSLFAPARSSRATI